MKYSDKTAAVMALVPEGGYWRDLPEDVAREAMGGAYGSGGGQTGMFRRLHRDRPSLTLVGSPAQKQTMRGHPIENRAINIEESAALQTITRTERSTMTDHSQQAVLSLFAGVGVSVACQSLGAEEVGVEWMPEANAIRRVNGMHTIYENVWDAHLFERQHAIWAEQGRKWTLAAGPPCQTFSTAGNGAGRRALDDVLSVIHDKAYLDMAELRERAAALGDERIGLVLSPLHYAFRFNPTYIKLEQVPPVLPVWEAMAVELREAGYSVWTGYLQAEMYGVPQTRKRAFLLARNDGYEALPPVPTHSRYYSRDPERLDPGVEKWVSMAEALPNMNREPWEWKDTPSTTVAGDPRITAREHHFHGQQNSTSFRLEAPEAQELQSVPRDFVWDAEYVDDKGRTRKVANTKKYLIIGNACPPVWVEAILESLWSTAGPKVA